jgi:signal transduction histidine kinase
VTATGIPAGETSLGVIALRDVTEQERLELSEREFVANAAHELRTPLTTIIGAVEILQDGAKDDPAARDRFLSHIEREAARLARLAHTLLVLARAQTIHEAPEVAEVRIAPLLENVARNVKPRRGVGIRVVCPPDLAARANADLLEHALCNLAENAAKYTASGEIVLRAGRAGSTLRIDVEDTGIGMTPETQRHVFDRFYRGHGRDSDGFGLGLSIVRQAIRALGGDIEVDSERGAGTRFTIVIAALPARVRV